MSTNYYALIKEKCPCCGGDNKSIHIGKSSVGWKFHMKSYNSPKLQSLEDWIAYLASNNTKITNEYGEQITLTDFLRVVISRGENPKSHVDSDTRNDEFVDITSVEFS